MTLTLTLRWFPACCSVASAPRPKSGSRSPLPPKAVINFGISPCQAASSPLMIQHLLIYSGLRQFSVIRHSLFWPILREPFTFAVLALTLCTAA